MKKIIYSLSVVLVLVLFAACTNYDDVRIEDFRVNGIKMESFLLVKIDAALKVNNPTKKKLVFKDADFEVMTNGAVFARLRMPGETTVPAKSADYQPMPLELKITDMVALLSGDVDLQHLDIEKFLVSGSLKVQAGWWSKTFPVENVTIEQLLNSL